MTMVKLVNNLKRLLATIFIIDQNNSSGLFYNLIYDEDRDKFTNTRNVSDSFAEVKTTVFVIITY